MTKLIVALDLPSVSEALKVVHFLRDLDVIYKIGPYLLLDKELQTLINKLQGYKLMWDTKLNDIPSTMKAGVTAAANRSILLMTLGAGIEQEQAKAAISGQRDGLPKLLMVVALTSTSSHLRGTILKKAVAALTWGLNGVIVTGLGAIAIRKTCGPNFIIACPGIREIGISQDDQRLVVTPRKAVKNGADYIIIGRQIVNSLDVRATTEGILFKMAEVS